MLWAFLRTLLAHCALVSRGTHGQLVARAASSAVGGDDRLFNKQAPLSSQLLCTFLDSQCWQTSASNCEMEFCWGLTSCFLSYSEFIPYPWLPLWGARCYLSPVFLWSWWSFSCWFTEVLHVVQTWFLWWQVGWTYLLPISDGVFWGSWMYPSFLLCVVLL